MIFDGNPPFFASRTAIRIRVKPQSCSPRYFRTLLPEKTAQSLPEFVRWVELVDGYVAEYQEKPAEIVIWTGYARSVGDAQALFREMDDKLVNSGVFSPSTDARVGDLKARYTQGLGMDHYYFQFGTAVYWLAFGLKQVDEGLIAEVVGRVLGEGGY